MDDKQPILDIVVWKRTNHDIEGRLIMTKRHLAFYIKQEEHQNSKSKRQDNYRK